MIHLTIAHQEDVWKAACSALINQEHGYQSIRGESVAAIKAWMQASSFGVMYRVGMPRLPPQNKRGQYMAHELPVPFAGAVEAWVLARGSLAGN